MFLLEDGTNPMINWGDLMIFLDTGYFKGLMDKKDVHHKDALKICECLDNFNATTVINTTVLVETLNWSVGTNDSVKELYSSLHDKNKVIYLTNEDYINSLEVNRWYGNSINYSDCTIINTMMAMGITRIVSFDDGFKKAGQYDVISCI